MAAINYQQDIIATAREEVADMLEGYKISHRTAEAILAEFNKMLSHCRITKSADNALLDKTHSLVLDICWMLFTKHNGLSGAESWDFASAVADAACDGYYIQLICDDYGKKLLDDYCEEFSKGDAERYAIMNADIKDYYDVCYKR